ncbi:hypothetical protein G7046_g8822 [Stylonectria norvegica]|nr:hypothetical protein G7046_g8822 [Stylonectria norvegica]
MPISNYGVWKATPTKFTAERARQDPISPHAKLTFNDGLSTKKLSSAINVKSLSSDSRLVYWLNRDFKHPIRDQIRSLELGWHGIDSETQDPEKSIGLDLLRGGIVKLGNGKVVPHDLPGPKNDIIDFLNPFFQNAIEKKATVYIFGEQYKSKDGEAFFIAFASQAVKTDESGQPDGATFAEFLDSPDDNAESDKDDGGRGSPRDHGQSLVFTVSAIVHQQGQNSADNPEMVYIQSNGSTSVSLGKNTWEWVSPKLFVSLSSEGAKMILWEITGGIIDKVPYTRDEAFKSIK